MSLKDKQVVVIPTIRESSFYRFIDEWLNYTDDGDDQFPNNLIVVQDNPCKIISSLPYVKRDINVKYFTWKDIDDSSMSQKWIIPRRSDTVRSFGYWYAFINSTNYECIMTLDDDCYPSKNVADEYNWNEKHHEALTNNSKWFNTLNSVKPRGIPFKNIGAKKVYLNHGIWRNVLDYDAPTQLVAPIAEAYSLNNAIVPSGMYFPFCGMNVAWLRELTPLMYHMLMGCVCVDDMPDKHVKNVSRYCIRTGDQTNKGSPLFKLPFDRFGDIWCGILMKKIVDHMGLSVSTGTPYIHHDRASDPFVNLCKEANGIKVNEIFWERIDSIELPKLLDSNDITQVSAQHYAFIGSKMEELFKDVEHSWYFSMLGDAMVEWAKLFIK